MQCYAAIKNNEEDLYELILKYLSSNILRGKKQGTE